MLRTRRTLRDALIALVLERGWDETSVQEVCERADVGRSTFYVHFADKEELLTSGLDDLRKALREHHAAPGRPALGFARGMIDHVHENRRLFRAIVGKRSGLVVQRRFRQLLLDLVREDLAALATTGPHVDGTVHYVAGAFFELLIWWVETRNPFEPSDVEELFGRLTTPVVAALRDSR